MTHGVDIKELNYFLLPPDVLWAGFPSREWYRQWHRMKGFDLKQNR